MKKFSSVVFTFFVLLVGINAQGESPRPDVGDETLFGESGLQLTGAWGGAFFGSTMYDSGVVSTRGGFGGLEFNRVLFIGIGSERTTQSVEYDGVDEGSFKLKHKGVFFGFSPLSHKVIHPKISFAMGGGEVKVGELEDDVFVVQPGAGLEMNVFQWWKLGLEGGYRFVTRNDIEGLENEDLSAFFVNLRLRFGISWGD